MEKTQIMHVISFKDQNHSFYSFSPKYVFYGIALIDIFPNKHSDMVS